MSTSAHQDKYRAAGVDPALAGELIKGLMKNAAPESPLPGNYFCQLIALPSWMAQEGGWLAISTDGVGTKILLGVQTGLLNGIGQDLVGMVYNDLITCGGQPFAFLDYYATGRIEPDAYGRVIRSIRAACSACDMPLLGGETAEMPGLYEPGDFDLAGFGIAGVQESEILSPAHVATGDMLVGIPSSGFHSNGYSLIRKVIQDRSMDLEATLACGGVSRKVKEWLMEPTRLYTDVIQAVRAHDVDVVALSHITGGGFFENLPRSLSDGCGATLWRNAFTGPGTELFQWFAGEAGMSLEEMLATFNSGFGMVAVCRPPSVDDVVAYFPGAKVLGEVIASPDKSVTLDG
jgi:phosphoribosylformylglycinamidine cyclo-ligase